MMSPSSPDLPSVKIQFPQMGTPVCTRNWVKPAGVLMRDQNEGDEDIHSSRWPKAKGMGDLKVRTVWGTLSGGEGPGGPDTLTDGQQTEPCARRGAEPRLRGGRRGPGSESGECVVMGNVRRHLSGMKQGRRAGGKRGELCVRLRIPRAHIADQHFRRAAKYLRL